MEKTRREKIKKNEHSDCEAKKKLHWSDDWTIEYFKYNHPNPQLSIVPPIAHVLPVVDQGPHQPYLVDVEVQGDKYSLLVF